MDSITKILASLNLNEDREANEAVEELMGYMKENHGDWLAVQHGTVLGQDLKKKYEVTRIPSLIVVTR